MKIIFLSISLLSLCFSTVLAVGEQDPNMVGFYFSTTPIGTEFIAELDPFEEIQVHLVLTNPTMSEICGWEAAFDITGTAWVGEPEFYHGGVNSLSGRNFSVEYPAPITCSGATLLASIPLVAIDGILNCIRLFGVDTPAIPGELPVLYMCGSTYFQVETSVFAGSDASAQLNGPMPLDGLPYACADPNPVSEMSWGALKGLYR